MTHARDIMLERALDLLVESQDQPTVPLHEIILKYLIFSENGFNREVVEIHRSAVGIV